MVSHLEVFVMLTFEVPIIEMSFWEFSINESSLPSDKLQILIKDFLSLSLSLTC